MAIVSVLTSSTTLLAAAEYKQIVLSNRGSNTVWCNFGATAVVGSGFPIDANDKIIIANHTGISKEDLNAISETSATNVSSYGF